jgi:carbon monoxide dehydrogenase subunit G
MATIRDEILINVPARQLWDAVRDIGALHTRLVPGFVTDCRLEDGGSARTVTFANGVVARELIVTLDDGARRLVWSAAGGRLTHHNASAQVFEEGADRCRLVWVADLLPDAMAPAIATMIGQGLQAMKKALESTAAAGHNAPRHDPPA